MLAEHSLRLFIRRVDFVYPIWDNGRVLGVFLAVLGKASCTQQFFAED